MGRLEQASWLDGTIELLRKGVRAVPLGGARDALHGRWLGHPLHPVLVQLPMGAWLSSAVLDRIPGNRRAATVLVGVGIAGVAPAAAAGLADWAELEDEQARVGLAHAVCNVLATTCYAVSLGARLAGRDGRRSALAGLAAAALSGAMGGHLAYRQAAGPNHAEAVHRLVPPGWHDLGEVADLTPGRPVRRTAGAAGDVAVLVLLQPDGTVAALADRCSHLAGSLSEGEVADGCVTCPLHGSTFRLSDGWNVTGPATAPQPVFDTRIAAGRLQIRLRSVEIPDAPEG